MGIKLAKTAGFCMGVKRAVDMVIELARQKDHPPIFTYGPLIHNPQTIELLKKRDVIPVTSLEGIGGIPRGSAMVIRAHGISPVERAHLKERGFALIDATCPKVAHVQAIIKKHAAAGYAVLIAGDREHPEVNGLLGFAAGRGIVIGSAAEARLLPPDLGSVCLVAQTTQSLDEYRAIINYVQGLYPKAVVFDTICDSTERRQAEIKTLAAESDAVFVVGGRESANTRRLAELAKDQGKPVFHIESAEELTDINIEPYRQIGVSAGASTPNWLIDRVVNHLTARMGRKEELVRRLFRAWVFAVRTDAYSVAGAACLAVAAMLLQGMTLELSYPLMAALYVFAMHVLNRFVNRRARSISSFREESYLLHEKRYLTVAVLSLLAALALAFAEGPLPFLTLCILSLAGILYNRQLLPAGWRFQKLQAVPGSKNIGMAFAWATVAAFLPWVGLPGKGTEGLLIAFLFTAGAVFIRSALSDLLDLQSDRLIGRETIPVLIGEGKTLMVLKALSALLAVLLITSSWTGWTGSLSLYLLSVLFYIWICFNLYDRRSAFSGVVLEGLFESIYIIAGLSSFLWLAGRS